MVQHKKECKFSFDSLQKVLRTNELSDHILCQVKNIFKYQYFICKVNCQVKIFFGEFRYGMQSPLSLCTCGEKTHMDRVYIGNTKANIKVLVMSYFEILQTEKHILSKLCYKKTTKIQYNQAIIAAQIIKFKSKQRKIPEDHKNHTWIRRGHTFQPRNNERQHMGKQKSNSAISKFIKNNVNIFDGLRYSIKIQNHIIVYKKKSKQQINHYFCLLAIFYVFFFSLILKIRQFSMRF